MGRAVEGRRALSMKKREEQAWVKDTPPPAGRRSDAHARPGYEYANKPRRVGALTRWVPRARVRRPHPPWPRGVGKGSDRGQRSKTRPWRCSARPELSQERYTGRGTEIKSPS